jgi:hypothetical protein
MTPKLQEKPSALKREHTALQNMKILYFFLFLWVIFALLDPDPATQINADPCGSGSETLQNIVIKLSKMWVWDPRSGIGKKFRIQGSKRHRVTGSKIPDPQHWFAEKFGFSLYRVN